ncbi:response regulator transcription factor [Massilia sp. R2A-15]|uniref:response regulator transcription factor n=1 Tax=Massilia sp. R2A-15 TaxID=3064278 RepID=UPI0027328BA7|nr:response regulator transcription factor [Massilia sp. R2A-15]WLI90555.1 response regulator transcription factor [Massilia sp. R2A-15]
MPLILIVEDEPAVAELVKFALGAHGWDCCIVATVSLAWEFIQARRPHLVVLDWMLRGQSGLHLLLRIRSESALCRLPVVMLSGRTAEQDRIDGLNSGADAYVTKPFSPRELLARASSLLGASPPDLTPPLSPAAARLALDEAHGTLRVDGRWVPIGAVEFRMLQLLVANPREVFSRGQLLGHIWESGSVTDERTVDVVVLRLRKVLGPARSLVKTVRGAGYMLAES